MPHEETRTVDHQYLIRASPERVFEALTDPKLLVRWLADHAELAPRPGGSYRLGWTDGPTHTGTIVEFEAGRTIALSWEWPGVTLKGTILRFSVEPSGEGTLLKLQHTGFPKREEWVELYGGAEWGWTYFAMNLKALLETGHDLRSPRDG